MIKTISFLFYAKESYVVLCLQAKLMLLKVLKDLAPQNINPFPTSFPYICIISYGVPCRIDKLFILLKEGLRLYPWCLCHIELVEI